METVLFIIFAVLGVIFIGAIGLLLYGILEIAYEIVSDTFIGPRFIPCMIICALVICLGIFLAIKIHMIWLILITMLIFPFCAFVVFVQVREYTMHKVIAKCKEIDFAAQMVGRDAQASFSLSEKTIGTGYTGKVYYTPSTKHMHITYNIVFELPNRKEIKLPYNDSTTTCKNKYGVLKYKRFGWFEFTPYENQEEGKAIFESKKRK